MTGNYTCHHFSLCNPENDGADDLPRLLRRVADLIEAEGIEPMEILDLTLSEDITGEGPWWSITVYWSPEPEEEQDR